jgi:signal transduction histidine kinase
LNIVFNLVVKQFGGSIAVSSTVGQGASFVLRIPGVTPAQELPADKPPEAQSGAPQHA